MRKALEKFGNRISSITESLETRRVQNSWRKLEKKINRTLKRLTREEWQVFLTDAVYWDPRLQSFYLNPKLDKQIAEKLQPLVNDFGSVGYDVVTVLRDYYDGEMFVTKHVARN